MHYTTHAFNGYESAAGELKKKTILITGAAGALGSALAMNIARLGGELILLDKSERGLNQLFDNIAQRTEIEAGLYPLDLAGASIEDYTTLANTVENEFGALHGLIHCAAELGQLAPMAYADPSQWKKTFATNVHGPVFLTASLLTLMKSSSPASIVFTVDGINKAYWSSYAATKAALSATMTSLADELDADRNEDGAISVTCNAVCPNKMRSSLRSSAFPGDDPSSLPDAEDNVAAYLFLLSDSAREMNGNIIDHTRPAG